MTKRVLSLLLTLVMVLSLCVPAIAADGEFVAEAPADVVEEAPAAPVEPEAPEAEEPAEEPVVDEPMAEEADAPEMAALMEEEDVPYLVALGVISHAAHRALQQAVEAAEPYKTRVDAGELYGSGDKDATLNDYEDDDPATAFNKAYERAETFLTDGLAGLEVGEDVTDYNITEAATTLKGFFPNDGSDSFGDSTKGVVTTGGNQYLMKNLANTVKIEITASGDNYNLYPNKYHTADGMVNNTYQQAALTDWNATGHIHYENFSETSAMGTTLTKASVFEKAPWTEMYRSDYLVAMKTAATAAVAFNKASVKSFKDFAEVKRLLRAAEALEKAAALPNQSECDQLAALLKEYDNAMTNGTESYVDNNGSGTDFNAYGGKVRATAAKKLFDQLYTGLNGFKLGVTYWDYYQALDDLQVALNKKGAKAEFVDQAMTSTQDITVTVGIPDVGTTDRTNSQNNDGTYYGYSIQIDGKYVNFANSWAKSDTKVILPLDKTSLTPTSGDVHTTPWSGTLTPTAFGTTTPSGTAVTGYKTIDIHIKPFGTDVFTRNSNVVVTLYKAYTYATGTTTTANDWNDLGKSYTFKFPGDMYFGPVIDTTKDIEVNYGDANAKFLYYGLDASSKKLDATSGAPLTVTVYLDKALQPFNTYYNYYKMAIVGSDGKDAGYVGNVTGGGGDFRATEKFATIDFYHQPEGEYKITASTMQVKYSVGWKDSSNVTGYSDLAAHAGGTANVTFNSITKWSGMTGVKELLEDVADLVQADYELKTTGGSVHGTVTTVADAWNVIGRDVSALQGYVNGGTYANTKANREAVILLANDLVQVYGYLKVKDVSRADLQSLVDKAAEFKPAEDYTYASWYKLQDALEDAQKAFVSGLQSDINAAYAALNSAIAGMAKQGEVDKTALVAAIAKANALVEADYTAESWAANKAAIDDAKTAAQAVVDNADATQDQVTTVLNALNGAMDKLVKKAPEGPKAPASGNGWVYDYATGDDYYFVNGKMVTNYWAGQSNGGSKWNLWYYLGSDGKLVKGFNYIVDDNGTGWYMLETGNGDTRGQMLTGWQKTGTAAGTGWFNTGRGADHGKCTYTSGWGDYSASTGMWADGLSHR